MPFFKLWIWQPCLLYLYLSVVVLNGILTSEGHHSWLSSSSTSSTMSSPPREASQDNDLATLAGTPSFMEAAEFLNLPGEEDGIGIGIREEEAADDDDSVAHETSIPLNEESLVPPNMAEKKGQEEGEDDEEEEEEGGEDDPVVSRLVPSPAGGAPSVAASDGIVAYNANAKGDVISENL